MSMTTKPRPTETSEPDIQDLDEKSIWMSLRARVAIIAVGAIVILVIAGAIIYTAITPTGAPAKSTSDSKSGASSSSSAPAPLTPIADTPMSKPRANSTLSDFLTKVAAVTPKTKNLSSVLQTVAAGAIVEEIANSQEQLASEGWSQKGVPTVVSLKILKSNPDAAKPTATVEACIDSSNVVVYDSKGKPVPIAGGKAGARALNIYSLQRTEGHWRVIARTFPNNPTC